MSSEASPGKHFLFVNSLPNALVLTLHRQRLGGWLGAIVLCLFCGCGPAVEERPTLHPTQGALTINGQPAKGALLVFHPVDDKLLDARGARPTATVDADGNFVLTTYQNGDGAPAGQYRVTILWFDNPDSSSAWDKLGNRFARAETSKILLTVGPEQAQLAPIQLDGVRIVPRRPVNSIDADDVD